MKKYKLVLVEWDDAAGSILWFPEESARDMKGIEVCSVGWLVAQNKRYVTIASSKNDQGEFSDRNSIPKGCLRKITELGEPEK